MSQSVNKLDSQSVNRPVPGGGLPYETDGDARRLA